jgi:hypothetical protein
MLFVLAHAEVSDASKLLVQRVISELVVLLAQDLLMSFHGVDRFGVAGAMQVRFKDRHNCRATILTFHSN